MHVREIFAFVFAWQLARFVSNGKKSFPLRPPFVGRLFGRSCFWALLPAI